MEQKRYPKNHFLGLGMAFGIPLGMPIGLAMGNIALGPAIGLILGLPIGVALEKSKNPNPRPLTQEEERLQKRNGFIGLAIAIALLTALVVVYFVLN